MLFSNFRMDFHIQSIDHAGKDLSEAHKNLEVVNTNLSNGWKWKKFHWIYPSPSTSSPSLSRPSSPSRPPHPPPPQHHPSILNLKKREGYRSGKYTHSSSKALQIKIGKNRSFNIKPAFKCRPSPWTTFSPPSFCLEQFLLLLHFASRHNYILFFLRTFDKVVTFMGPR